ncbi:MAG: LexA family protein [Candidatus Methylacidiphilales bacterium]|nr:S24 family peptidase [Candidatus Methylacidiphilales bacterium]
MPKRRSQVDQAENILTFIETYHQENLRPPTIREIQRHCGFKSPRAVSYNLEKLEAAHKIIRQSHSRGILVARPTKTIGQNWQIPLYAAMPAGGPEMTDSAAPTEALRLSPAAVGVTHMDRAYAVRVKGDSMIGAGIMAGDVVILERKPAKPGDIIAAQTEGETTLKRLVEHAGRLFLKAENPLYKNLEPVQELESQGVAVGIIRNLAAISLAVTTAAAAAAAA